MQRLIRIFLLIAACVSAACEQHLTQVESQLIGDWRSVVSEDHVFAINSLKPDHTFLLTAYTGEGPPARILSGSWRVSGNRLIIKFTWKHPSVEQMFGQELQLVISDLQQDKFVFADAKNEKISWTRVK